MLKRDKALAASISTQNVETSIASWSRYSSSYYGDAFVRLTAKKGTVAKLDEIGVAANTGTIKLRPLLKMKSNNWKQNNASFKLEGRQISIQLGEEGGLALRTFNEGLVKFQKISRNNQTGKQFRSKTFLDRFVK